MRNIETLAVLPFINVSGDAKDEYFSDGITDELANALSKRPRLRLAGRSSSFASKGKNVNAKEIGQQLDVAAVIEGTVRRAAGRVRIAVQLTSTADGKALWQNSYENDKGDMLGEYDKALDMLEASWDSNFLTRTPFASPSCHELLLPLRTNPRFTALLDRGGMRRCTHPTPVKWPIAPRRLAPDAGSR